MKVGICTKENYESTLNSNLYDYLVIKEDTCIFSFDFADTINKIASQYTPDVIYTDYSIDHQSDNFVEKVYCQSLIFSELKIKPAFIKCPIIKVSVIRKYGINLEKIINPNNNLLFWHIPKNLFMIGI